MAFVEVNGAVHPGLYALGNNLLQFVRFGFILLQADESCFPLGKFGVGDSDVLDDGVTLILILQFGDVPFDLGRFQELALRGVEYGALRNDIE